MEQQNKMDNKAYIFISFVAVIFSRLYPDLYQVDPRGYLLIGITIPFIFSLLPIANNISTRIISHLSQKPIRSPQTNIFYYIDVYRLNMENFKLVLKEEYDFPTFSATDIKMIEEIIINAKILRTKVFWHSFAYWLAFIYILALIIF